MVDSIGQVTKAAPTLEQINKEIEILQAHAKAASAMRSQYVRGRCQSVMAKESLMMYSYGDLLLEIACRIKELEAAKR